MGRWKPPTVRVERVITADLPKGGEVPDPPVPEGANRKIRRVSLKAMSPRQLRKRRARITRRAFSIDEIPAGSILAPKTDAQIRAGVYAWSVEEPAPHSPTRATAPKRHRRLRMAKLSRRRNRR